MRLTYTYSRRAVARISSFKRPLIQGGAAPVLKVLGELQPPRFLRQWLMRPPWTPFWFQLPIPGPGLLHSQLRSLMLATGSTSSPHLLLAFIYRTGSSVSAYSTGWVYQCLLMRLNAPFVTFQPIVLVITRLAAGATLTGFTAITLSGVFCSLRLSLQLWPLGRKHQP